MGAAEGINGLSNGNGGIGDSGAGPGDDGVGSVGGAGGLALEPGGGARGDFVGGFVAAFGGEAGGDVGAAGEVGGGEDGVGGDGVARVSISTFIPERQWPGTPQMKNLLPEVKRVMAVLPSVCFSMGLLAEQELKSASLTSSTSWFAEYTKTVNDSTRNSQLWFHQKHLTPKLGDGNTYQSKR